MGQSSHDRSRQRGSRNASVKREAACARCLPCPHIWGATVPAPYEGASVVQSVKVELSTSAFIGARTSLVKLHVLPTKHSHLYCRATVVTTVCQRDSSSKRSSSLGLRRPLHRSVSVAGISTTDAASRASRPRSPPLDLAPVPWRKRTLLVASRRLGHLQ